MNSNALSKLANIIRTNGHTLEFIHQFDSWGVDGHTKGYTAVLADKKQHSYKLRYNTKGPDKGWYKE